MDFMPLRFNSSSLTRSICALAAIILQLVAMECQKLHIVDSPIVEFHVLFGCFGYFVVTFRGSRDF